MYTIIDYTITKKQSTNKENKLFNILWKNEKYTLNCIIGNAIDKKECHLIFEWCNKKYKAQCVDCKYKSCKSMNFFKKVYLYNNYLLALYNFKESYKDKYIINITECKNTECLVCFEYFEKTQNIIYCTNCNYSIHFSCFNKYKISNYPYAFKNQCIHCQVAI